MSGSFLLSIILILSATSLVISTATIQVNAQNSSNSTNANMTNGTQQHRADEILLYEPGLNSSSYDTKWAKYFSQNPSYENVTVVFESPNLIVLDYSHHTLLDVEGEIFWKAVENVLLDGFKLTGIISDDQIILTR